MDEMSEEENKRAHEKEFEEVGMVLEAVEHAKKYGLQYEFLMFFIREIQAGVTIPSAISFAQAEWDI